MKEEVQDHQYEDRDAQQPTNEILAHDDVSLTLMNGDVSPDRSGRRYRETRSGMNEADADADPVKDQLRISWPCAS